MPREDEGHEMLIVDLEALLANARNFQYHDFKNELYATPKMVQRKGSNFTKAKKRK